MNNWTLFSNHGHVLVCLARNPELRLRDVAADVGITERAVQKIVRDLQENGMLSVTKHGRRNRYRIHREQTLRHALESHCTLGELVKFVKIPEQVAPPPVAVKPEPTISKPAKPGTGDSIAKQQGSLF